MKITPLSLLAILALCVVGCTSIGSTKFPKAADSFSPKKAYPVAYAAAWQKIQLTLDNARIPIASANKDESSGRIQTDNIAGQSALIGGGLIAAQSTRYRFSLTVRPDGDKTNIGIVCLLESTMHGRRTVSQWTDVSGQNAALTTQLENWLYEQIEKNL